MIVTVNLKMIMITIMIMTTEIQTAIQTTDVQIVAKVFHRVDITVINVLVMGLVKTVEKA